MHRLVSCAITAVALIFTALASAQPTTYAVDPLHTTANFEVLHYGTSTLRGRFGKNSGTVKLDRLGKTGRVGLTIDMAGLSTGVVVLDKRMEGVEFFDVTNHPTARFVGERLVFDGDRVIEVGGELTLRGKTVPVNLKAIRFNCYDSPLFRRQVCGGDFETIVKRSLFGVMWGLDLGVSDDTKVLVQVEAVRQ